MVIGSNDTNEQNVGCGYRHLFADDKVMLGANLYYDTKHSKNNFRHHQLGFGFEAFITEYLDFRTNFYLPISDKKRLEENTSYSFGQRNLIARTETLFEEALKGMDYEFGLLVPFLSDYVETRAYLGGYNYYPELSDDINGIQARFEIRPTSSFVIDLSIKHDDTFNTNAYIGGYVSVPFNIGNLFRMKNPFEGWKEAMKFGEGPRSPRERMTDMVVRDIDVVSQESVDTSKTQERSLASMIYVNNLNDDDANENGSLDHPYNTLQEGMDVFTGGEWIYVFKGDGTAVGHFGTFILQDGMTIWGEGYQYLGLGGSGYPVVMNILGLTALSMGNNSTIMGLQIEHPNRRGISISNKTAVNIHHNYITNTAYGIYCSGNNSEIVISNNRLETMSNSAIYMRDEITAIVADNTIDTLVLDGVHLFTIGNCSVIISNNTITNANNAGICAAAPGGTLNIVINNNRITGSGAGIFLRDEGGDCSYSIYKNTIADNTNGISLGDVGAGTWTFDAGGGPLGSPGKNSIYDNTNLDFNNNSGEDDLKAQYNYWGPPPAPQVAQFGGVNSVDYSNHLTSDPN